tara:strand:- start:261 stop:680 length:420 start_codon:yes stop_codon:yes gene_type:complete
MAEAAVLPTQLVGDRDNRYEYYQFTKSATDFNTAKQLVPARAGHIAVIDSLIVTCLAAEIVSIESTYDPGSGSAAIDLFGPHYVAANGSLTLPAGASIRHPQANQELSMKTASSGACSVFIIYHYELDSIEESFTTAYY